LSNVTKAALTAFELSVDYHIDMHRRRVYLSDEIDEKTTDLMLKALHHLDAKEGDIEFWINSGGGSVYHMYAIYDAIRNCKNKVICIGTGHVASAATLLLVAGDESYATKHTMFMAHEGSIDFTEDESISPIAFLADLAADMELEERYCRLMAEHTKPTKGWWKKYAIESKKSIWMDVDDMIDKEIIKAEWPII
jgi:ATP-dependent protease ClpP protease subunit